MNDIEVDIEQIITEGTNIQQKQHKLEYLQQNFGDSTPSREGPQQMSSIFESRQVSQYTTNALYCLSQENNIRKLCIWLVDWIWFERFIILVILFNTIILGLQDYSFRKDNSEPLPNWKDDCEIAFTIIFIIEFVVKIIAMGFFFGENTYLRDGWNVIDFAVVVTGIISFFISARFSAIRVIRIIRPLRSINSLKEMRILVTTLLNSLPALGNVVIFLFFIIVLFGILGLQIFLGTLESRCRLTPEPVNGVWKAAPEVSHLCSSNSDCPEGLYCGNPIDWGLDRQEEIDEYLNYGYTNYDNIISATFTIFQSLTLEGWSVLIEIFQDAVSPFIVYIYYLLLIFIGSFFVVNLILAVINNSFVNAQENREQKEFNQEKRQKDTFLKQPQDNLMSEFRSSPEPIINHVFFSEQGKQGEIKSQSDINQQDNQQQVNQQNENQEELQLKNQQYPIIFTTQNHLTENSQKGGPSRSHNIFYVISQRKEFTIFITAIILSNTITLSFDRYPISDEESFILDIFNKVFTSIFTLELIIKFLGMGINYVKDQLNIFDAIIVILSLIEWVLDSIGNQSSGGSFSAVQAFRTLRLFRLFKLARTWVSFRKLLVSIAATISEIVNFVFLLILFMTISSLLGMELFAYQVDIRYNFNNFLQAMLSVFMLLTNEGWNTMAYSFMHQQGSVYPVIYFVIVIIFGNFILLKLFIAILINNFHEANQDDKEPSNISFTSQKNLFSQKNISQKNLSVIQSNQTLQKQRSKRYNSQAYQSQYIRAYSVSGKSLCLFSETNIFRTKIAFLVHNKYFQFFIIAIIVFSSILLALDDPLTTTQIDAFSLIDEIITALFIVEALLKIIAKGFLFNGPHSYLRQPANFLDIIVIIFSSFSFNPYSSQDFSKIKVLRVIRVLRPLRLVLRNEDLKQAINALASSLAQMLNITLIVLIFFLLFGIFGVTLFKGTYFYCDLTENINDKWECFDKGGSWINQFYNFDNVLNAIIQLFVTSTTEGWVTMMSVGIDSRGIDLNPQQGSKEGVALYFVLFIIVGSFFLLNFFAGVIVEAFLTEREKLQTLGYIQLEEQEWFELQLKIFKSKPIVKFIPKDSVKKLYKIVQSNVFEIIILTTIILNTIILMLQFARQPTQLGDAIQILNWIFLVIFTIEAIIKIIVYRTHYFKNTWNIFDFCVVLLTIIGVILEQSNILSNVGTATSVLRTFRIFRVLRLVKSAKNLRIIFGTFLRTLPGLMSVGTLLIIMLFIFAIIFMNLYPYVKFGIGINEFANFSTFFKSIFTLFKSSTGEDWNLIMAATAKQIQPNDVCFDISDAADYLKYGFMGCGNDYSIPLMIIFQIIIGLIMLNLFVAVIIEGFQDTSKEENSKLKQTDIEIFQEYWIEYDPKGSGFIPSKDLQSFLRQLPPPLGWNRVIKSKLEQLKSITDLELQIFNIKQKQYYNYYDTLICLTQQHLENEYEIYSFTIENTKAKQKLKVYQEKIYNKVNQYASEFFSHQFMAVLIIQKYLLRKKKEKEKKNQIYQKPILQQNIAEEDQYQYLNN